MNTNTSIDSASIANFTNLVRLGIGHQAESLIEPVDWNAIETLAERQGLSAVVLDGINRLPESVRPPKIMLLQWIGEVMQGYEQRYVLYREAEAGLGAWYREHGFRMMLLKGLACGLRLNATGKPARSVSCTSHGFAFYRVEHYAEAGAGLGVLRRKAWQ